MRASPKSQRRTSSCVPPPHSTFDGLTSRWTTPARCAAPSAAAELRRQDARARADRADPSREPIGEIAARMEVHDEEQLPVALDDVADREHVRVSDPPDDLHLALEALGDRCALAQVRVEDLERDLGARLLVARAHDLGDGAAAKHAQ